MLIGRKNRSEDNQDHPYPGKAGGVDFAAPSIIRELLPNEKTQGDKVSEYAVEVGGTIIPARYFRSFFAEIMSGHTWSWMLESLMENKNGYGDVDLAIHIQPSSNDKELDAIGRRIAGLLADLDNEKDVRKIDAMRDEIADLKDRQKRIRLNIERSFRVAIQVIASSTEYKGLLQLCRSSSSGGPANRFICERQTGSSLKRYKQSCRQLP